MIPRQLKWLLLLWVLLEIAGFVGMYELVGLWPMLGIVAGTMIIGGWIMKRSGINPGMLQGGAGPAAMMGMMSGGSPVKMLAGILLLIPGFFSDLLGLLLLIPALQRKVLSFVLKKAMGGFGKASANEPYNEEFPDHDPKLDDMFKQFTVVEGEVTHVEIEAENDDHE